MNKTESKGIRFHTRNKKRMSIDDEIDRITKELVKLKLKQEQILVKRQNLSKRLVKLNKEKRQREEALPYRSLDIERNRIDSFGAELEVGDTVRYLSEGIQQTDTGIIEGFGKRFVISRDGKGRAVNKEPKNLEKDD